MKLLCLSVFSALLCALSAPGAPEFAPARFDFGSGPPAPGWTRVAPGATYGPQVGYGFEPGAVLSTAAGGVASDRPFAFSIKAPEGNYRVRAILGDGTAASTVTVKAEDRRLMVEQAPVAAGVMEPCSFTVNVRTAAIAGGLTVRLDARESGPPLSLRWDEKLTLEFNGARPALHSLEITRADDAVTVFLAGDSTVTDQPAEPWTGWGQMLPRFFLPGVAVANHAESGRALASFKNENRLEKIRRSAKAGDYLMIQFGHNDQKEKGEGVGPFTTYKQHLIEWVRGARADGMRPVLVTSMERRRFAAGRPTPTLADFAEAVRQVGREEHVPVIDLNATSLRLYTALGEEGSTRAFVHYPAGSFLGQDKDLKDDTHHSPYGAYELARCVVEGIKVQVPELAKLLIGGLPPFDPDHPDPVNQFDVPASPRATDGRPFGS